MSKLQFITVITSTVSSFVLVILAWLNSNQRLTDAVSAMNRNFDRMDKRFESIDRKFESIERRLDRIDSDLKEFYGTTKRLEGRVDEISRREQKTVVRFCLNVEGCRALSRFNFRRRSCLRFRSLPPHRNSPRPTTPASMALS